MVTKGLTWSNDPCDLDLNGAFSEVRPNLSSDFNIEGVRPVLKEKTKDDRPWILQDAEGSFYL